MYVKSDIVFVFTSLSLFTSSFLYFLRRCFLSSITAKTVTTLVYIYE